MFQFNLNENKIAITYKLLNDLLFLLLIFFSLTLIAEGLLPGIVSSHISFLRIIFFLIFNIFAIYITGSFLKINYTKQKINKKIVALTTILAIVLIFNSLIKINLFLAIIVLILIIFSGYLLYKTVIEN